MNVGPKQPNSSTVAATNKFSRAFGYISFPPVEKGGVGEDGLGECGCPVWRVSEFKHKPKKKVNVGPKQPNSSTVAATNKFSRAFGYISFPPLEKGGVGEDGVGECGGPVWRMFGRCIHLVQSSCTHSTSTKATNGTLTASVSNAWKFAGRWKGGGGGGGTDLQILGFPNGCWGGAKNTVNYSKNCSLGENYKESSCCKKCVLREPNFVVFVVSREADLKRAMCKKHCKYREKLACKHVCIQLLHFVFSSFYIAPRRCNIAPR